MKTPLFLKRMVVRFPILMTALNGLGYKKDFEIRTFLKHIRKGDVVWDVGANIGRFTQLFCCITGSQGKVIALEPLSINFQTLSQLRFSHLTCHPLGLAKNPGEASFFYPPRDGAQASLQKQSFGNWVGEEKLGAETCRLETLNRLILVEHWPLPDFIKIDAEGAEYQILQGGDQVLKNNAIILFIELNQETLKSFHVTLTDFWNLLQQLGYDEFTLVGRAHQLAIHSLDDLNHGMQLHFSPSLLCRKIRLSA